MRYDSVCVNYQFYERTSFSKYGFQHNQQNIE